MTPIQAALQKLTIEPPIPTVRVKKSQPSNQVCKSDFKTALITGILSTNAEENHTKILPRNIPK